MCIYTQNNLFCFFESSSYYVPLKMHIYLVTQVAGPTPYTFLRRFLRAAVAECVPDRRLDTLAHYLLELSLEDYSMLHFLPSQVPIKAGGDFCTTSAFPSTDCSKRCAGGTLLAKHPPHLVPHAVALHWLHAPRTQALCGCHVHAPASPPEHRRAAGCQGKVRQCAAGGAAAAACVWGAAARVAVSVAGCVACAARGAPSSQ